MADIASATKATRECERGTRGELEPLGTHRSLRYRTGRDNGLLPHLIWTILWLSWNIFAPKPLRFDPHPAFVLWLFISNMIQIFLMPLIMVGQNLQGRHADLRAESDYEVNVKAENEVEAILMHLENQSDLMLKILQRIEILEQRQVQVGKNNDTTTPSVR